ncbi:MAG: ATPase, T2SS/T4P/T4SS family [Coriobacteriia bacterium]
MTDRRPVVLTVDDDPDLLDLHERVLEAAGYEVATARDGEEGLRVAEERDPDVVLLDLMMPRMDGFAFCERLLTRPGARQVPVVFVTAVGGEQDRARAFAVGAADYLVKPVMPADLVSAVERHLEGVARWDRIEKETRSWSERIVPARFLEFKEKLLSTPDLSPQARAALVSMTPDRVYESASGAGMSPREMARAIAEFLGMCHAERIEPEQLRLGVLPTPFCRRKLVVPVWDDDGEASFVVCDPFDWELVETLERQADLSSESGLCVAAPDVVRAAFGGGLTVNAQGVEEVATGEDHDMLSIGSEWRVALEESAISSQPVAYVANSLLLSAVEARASDIHIEPKPDESTIRFRVDGDLRDIVSIGSATAARLISRFKAIAGLDIAERRKPQDGMLEASIRGAIYKLRLATTSTPSGESLVIRLLDVTSGPGDLEGLGMSVEQAKELRDLAKRTMGLVLVVGPTGSGKSTTAYSMLSSLDLSGRSLVTVEDPVEYRIPLANQQQVNEKAGLTFESLLRSVVRQDPDVLFLGEIRDSFSAKAAVDFSSTGHLTLSTVHASNAMAAVFRLERLGVNRPTMADALLAIVAQRLVKRLCPDCRRIEKPTPDEIKMLEPFLSAPLERVARPIGCPACGGTGFRGRRVVAEVIEFDDDVAEMVRRGDPVTKIRLFVRGQGVQLMADAAVQAVLAGDISVADAYRVAIADDPRLEEEGAAVVAVAEPAATATPAPVGPEALSVAPSILVVEDDEDSAAAIERMLLDSGHLVTVATDGVDALLQLGRERFDLVLSDVDMPLLDGFQLLEMTKGKGIGVPVVLLTASGDESYEARALQLGAADYIRKPVRKDVLLARLGRILGR